MIYIPTARRPGDVSGEKIIFPPSNQSALAGSNQSYPHRPFIRVPDVRATASPIQLVPEALEGGGWLLVCFCRSEYQLAGKVVVTSYVYVGDKL